MVNLTELERSFGECLRHCVQPSEVAESLAMARLNSVCVDSMDLEFLVRGIELISESEGL